MLEAFEWKQGFATTSKYRDSQYNAWEKWTGNTQLAPVMVLVWVQMYKVRERKGYGEEK